MNLSVPPRLHSAENPIAFAVADDCGRNKASSLDAVRQADPISRGRGLSAGDAGTMAILDVVGDASNPVGVVNDSASLARSGRARDTGMSLTLVADDGANTVAAEPTSAEIDCLDVHSLGLALPNGRQLLSNVSFSARPGSLTAIIGPSGAGKSTLAKLVGGAITPTAGEVSFEGRDLHGEYASLRHRIGLVPQDDVVHHQLTVDAALRFAAELRLPHATADERAAAVRRVLEELELTGHAHTRVDKLSGGQRKRASVAMELLTGPALLILDEPTTGLDPALDRQVMSMLRRLADAGRVVLVVTHCLTHLDLCDQVLFLAPGGRTAYCGPPREIGAALGTTNWADLFASVAADLDAAHREFATRCHAEAPPARLSRPRPASSLRPAPCRLLHQASTVARRQLPLLLADRGHFLFLAVLPFILGTLALLVPGHVGLGAANPRGDAADEPVQIVFLLSISAVFMGTALTIRDLVGERTIFRREQAVGLSATAYLLAKIAVCAMTAAQTAILTTIVVVGKGAPTPRRRRGGQSDPGAVFDPGGDDGRRRGHGVGDIGGGQVPGSDPADAGDLSDAVHRVLRRDDSGHRPTCSRAGVLGDPGPLGIRSHRVHHRSAHHRSSAANKRDAVVAPRWLVAARHDRTDPRGSRPGRQRALAHPAQRRSTNSRSHRLVSMVHAAAVTSSDAAPVSAGMGARTTPLWSLPALGRQSSPSG
jgi:ABC-type multidrug transport system ATPase subunit